MKDMKWGNVSHHYLCCHIYYYILYNEKADEKPKKKLNRTVATLVARVQVRFGSATFWLTLNLNQTVSQPFV